MPRPLVFGNRRFLAAVDDRHRIRDLFWPGTGWPNHLCGKAVAWGVFVDGAMHWVDQDDWTISMAYEEGALAAKCRLENPRAGLRIETEEACHPESPWLVRRAVIRDLSGRQREIKVYWNHELWIDESQFSNTAMYSPQIGGMVHYKQNRYALFRCSIDQTPMTEWSAGVRTEPKHGSWTQAQTGQLDMKSREVGMVDSTMGGPATLPANGSVRADWWLVMADSLEGLARESAKLADAGLDGVLAAQRESALDLPPGSLSCLSDSQAALARRSLQIIQTQIDVGGGILAANDSDAMWPNTLNYSNVWHRDGALVADALLDAGAWSLVEDWLEFCIRTLPSDGLYQQKYWPSGALGVSWNGFWKDGKEVKPIQLDETALVVWNACRARALAAPDFAARLDDELIRPALSAILGEIQPDGLPAPSWDLWEERRGISFYSCCSVLAALQRACLLAEGLGWPEAAAWRREEQRVKAAVLTRLTGPDGAFVRQLDEHGNQDPTVDAALAGGLALGGFDAEVPQARATLAKVRSALLDRCPIGGCARYEGDYYHRQSEEYPGTPWIICTLFVAQVHLLLGDNAAEPSRLLNWCQDRAASTGVLSEQVHPDTGAPLSVSPLTWSHAEFLRTSFALNARLAV